MKKSLLILILSITINFSFGQNNPVQTLTWDHYYDYTNFRNIYSLSWQEPETPHSALIGYNIYRGSELYKFQTTTAVGCNPDWGITSGCDFLTKAFEVYVKAVYEGNIESEAVSYTIHGPALDTKEISFKLITIAPNPVKNILNISENVSNIRITDLSGKIIAEIPTSEKSIDVSKLAKGTYIMTATSKTKDTITKKFIKN